MKALIIYGSTGGNTQLMSEAVAKTLASSGFTTEIKEVIEADQGDLTADHNLLLLGCPAYGEDTNELQEDFEDFYYDNMEDINLDGKRYAVFAPGDLDYEFFCGSVDILEERMDELGARKVVDGLRIDGNPEDAMGEIEAWAGSVAGVLI